MNKLVKIVIVVILVVVALLFIKTMSSTSSVTSNRGIFTAVPSTVDFTPYVPKGYTLMANADLGNNDISLVNQVTVDQAIAQMPASAVGFQFAVSDSSMMSATSLGTAYYKSAIDYYPDSTSKIYRRSNGSETYEHLDGFAIAGNGFGGGNGTIAKAIATCQSNTACDGFTWNSSDSSFELKTRVSPFSYFNWSSWTYAISTYVAPTHTWTAVA